MDRQKDLLLRVLLPSKKKADFYGLSIFGRVLSCYSSFYGKN